MKRYFFIQFFHKGTIGDGTAETFNGEYPNRDVLSLKFGSDGMGAVICNIVELSEQDYNDWIK